MGQFRGATRLVQVPSYHLRNGTLSPISAASRYDRLYFSEIISLEAREE